jgi:hypothetical protein
MQVFNHGHDCRPAGWGRCQGLLVLAAGVRHDIGGDIGTRISAADAGIDEDDVTTGVDDAVAEVDQLGTFGIECPDQDHDRHGYPSVKCV